MALAGPTASLSEVICLLVSGHLIFMAVSADVLLRKKVKLDDELGAREKPVRMLSQWAAESGQGRGHCHQQV